LASRSAEFIVNLYQPSVLLQRNTRVKGHRCSWAAT